MRAALINIESDTIENIIELPDDYNPEAKGAYLPPSDYKIEIDNDGEADIGGNFKDGVWEKSPKLPDLETKASIQKQLDSLIDILVEKAVITKTEADEDVKHEIVVTSNE